MPLLGLFFCLFVLSYCDVLLFVLLYLIYFIITPQKPACFLLRDRKGVDLDGRGGGEELRGAEGKESVINERKSLSWFDSIQSSPLSSRFMQQIQSAFHMLPTYYFFLHKT